MKFSLLKNIFKHLKLLLFYQKWATSIVRDCKNLPSTPNGKRRTPIDANPSR